MISELYLMGRLENNPLGYKKMEYEANYTLSVLFA